MQLMEITVENYMQALLKAALLLGDPHRTEAIPRICVCCYRPGDSTRQALPRCLIFRELAAPFSDSLLSDPAGRNVEYRILYPESGKSG